MYTTFNENMEKHRILLWNASDDAGIQPRLSIYGYTAEKLHEGQSLWEQTNNYGQLQNKEKDEQKAATNNFNEKWQQSISEIKRFKKLARLVFDTDPNAWNMLKLDTLNISKFADWYADTDLVYTNILEHEEWITAMQGLGYTNESITTMQTKLRNLKNLQQTKQQEIGDAQQATDLKWNSYNQLKDFCYKLREVAKIEFENDPQLLEKLGILVRSNA
ncbi:hypothetical protein DF185_09285 [Marinifilum breve]|uniref:Uncharacterized protein n=1 Tax=Marinifilum breve TaxID=2184082 RepID=A0A2V4A2T7_9BACT|nr:hypothetical protein [Marinifilum breve]PXY01650.1 hypothetical protein DF185_09285 [Marinifilum breve]